MKKTLSVILSVILVMAFAITSLGATVSVKSIKLSAAKISLKIGKTQVLKVTIAPANATNKKLTYKSSNIRVATVDSNGKIKGIKAGKTVITVTSSSNNKAVAKCTVTVPQKMTMFFNATWFDATNWGKDIVSNLMMDKVGIDLTIVTPAADDNQKLNMMLASGEKLPDFINVDRMNDALVKMIDGKKIYSYDELAAKYCPDFQNLPFVKANRKIWEQPDGKLYYFSGTCIDAAKLKEGKYILGNGGYFIRDDIYKALGSPALKTTDDLLAVLKQVKAKYPEITHPLLPYMLMEGIGYEAHAMFNFYFTFGGEGFTWNDGSDNLKIHWRDPRYLDALLYVNKLYREGLINIADFTDTQDQMDVNLRSEKVFCSVGPVGNSLEANPELAKINPNMKYTAIDPILAPGVKEYKYPAWFGLGWMCPTITKDCKDPEVAMKFIEYTCTYEQQAMSYAGREGIDWKWGGSDGKSIVLIGQAKKDYDASYDAWSLKYGARREYSFNGNLYFRDCLTWGNAIGNPERMKVIELNSKVNIDAMKYSYCYPDNGSEERTIAEKVDQQIHAYAGRIIMAKSESEARSLHAELIKKIDDSGYSKTEKMLTDKYKKYGTIIMDMLK